MSAPDRILSVSRGLFERVVGAGVGPWVGAGHASVSFALDRYGHLYPQQDDELTRRLERRAASGRSVRPVVNPGASLSPASSTEEQPQAG